MKKGLIFGLVPALLTLVSAYGEQSWTTIGGFYINTEMVFAGIAFLLIFWGITYGVSKLKIFPNTTTRIIMSIILSLFALYGLSKTGFSYEGLFLKIGIAEFMYRFFPWILLTTAILAMLFWGLGAVVMISGGIIGILGLIGSINEEIVYNWEILLMIGISVFIIGLWIKKKGGHYFGTPRMFKSIRIMKKRIIKLQQEFNRIHKINPTDNRLESLMKQINDLTEKLRKMQEERNNVGRQYNKYSARIQQILKRYNRRVPSATSPNPRERRDSREYSQLINAMKEIEKQN
ncbi:hypothetical protein GW932_03225 [archaeon]|nr:hypothetical protein [archaeon]